MISVSRVIAFRRALPNAMLGHFVLKEARLLRIPGSELVKPAARNVWRSKPSSQPVSND